MVPRSSRSLTQYPNIQTKKTDLYTVQSSHNRGSPIGFHMISTHRHRTRRNVLIDHVADFAEEPTERCSGSTSVRFGLVFFCFRTPCTSSINSIRSSVSTSIDISTCTNSCFCPSTSIISSTSVSTSSTSSSIRKPAYSLTLPLSLTLVPAPSLLPRRVTCTLF